MAAAPFFALSEGMDRGPELSLPSGGKLKGRWQHADDGVGFAIQSHSLADDVFSAAEPFLPGLVRCDDIIAGARLVFTIVEIAAEDRSNAENTKESRGDSRASNGLDSGRRSHQVSRSGVSLHRTKDLVHLLPIDEVRIGEIRAREHLGRLRYIDEARGVVIGQRPDQRSIHKPEDRHAGAYSKCEHEDCSQGKTGAAAKLAQRKVQILEDSLEPEPHDLVAPLLQACRIAKLAHRRSVDGIRSHARSA